LLSSSVVVVVVLVLVLVLVVVVVVVVAVVAALEISYSHYLKQSGLYMYCLLTIENLCILPTHSECFVRFSE
jgi:p-aminobenzoyl-glutamate transporter AbgT